MPASPRAWDGVTQNTSETDKLLAGSYATAVPPSWQRNLALLLLAIMTTLSLALVAVTSQMTFKLEQLSRAFAANASASPNTTLDIFPLLGDDCSLAIDIDRCVVNLESGSPLLFEDYWIDNPAAEVRVPASFHLGYGGQLPALEAAIRAVHAKVGNAVTEGRQIVIGMSSTQLIGAAMYAFSSISRAPHELPTKVYASVPYYNTYEALPSYFDSHLFKWAANDTTVRADQPVIDIITAPNNPDGIMRNKTVPGAYGLYDHAYYWPHLTPIAAPVQYGTGDIACFTLSKLTGHAGSRIGWAVVQDEAVAELMRRHVSTASGYVQESQLRAAALLQYVLSTNGSVMDYAMSHMEERWRQLRSIAALSTRLRFQDLEPPQQDSWTGRRRSPSPAYAWLHCTEERDKDCYQAMADSGIIGRPGHVFGSGADYNRLELLMQPAVFDSFAAKLRQFVLA